MRSAAGRVIALQRLRPRCASTSSRKRREVAQLGQRVQPRAAATCSGSGQQLAQGSARPRRPMAVARAGASPRPCAAPPRASPFAPGVVRAPRAARRISSRKSRGHGLRRCRRPRAPGPARAARAGSRPGAARSFSVRQASLSDGALLQREAPLARPARWRSGRGAAAATARGSACSSAGTSTSNRRGSPRTSKWSRPPPAAASCRSRAEQVPVDVASGTTSTSRAMASGSCESRLQA